ncbi:MAG: T9SS type A sorting domain-containing protein, partial [Bacteroidota bacterium]
KGTACLPINIEDQVEQSVSIWSVDQGVRIQAPFTGNVSITDLTGRMVLASRVNQGDQYLAVPSGVYLVTYTTESAVSITRKVIVQ